MPRTYTSKPVPVTGLHPDVRVYLDEQFDAIAYRLSQKIDVTQTPASAPFEPPDATSLTIPEITGYLDEQLNAIAVLLNFLIDELTRPLT